MSATITAEQVQEKVFSSLVTFGADPEVVSRDAAWSELDVDSLDLVELAQVVEEEYGIEITSQDMQNVPTVGAVIDLVVARSAA